MTALRIGVDGHPLSVPYTGVGRYLSDLLYSLEAVQEGLTFSIPDFWRRTKGAPPLSLASVTRPGIPLTNTVYRRAATRVPLSFDRLTGHVDMQLYPAYHWFHSASPTASIIYDLNAFTHADTLHPILKRTLHATIEETVRRTDLILTISKTVAAEIRERFPTAGRIEILYPGLTNSLPRRPPVDWRQSLGSLGVEPGYVLIVGTIQPRKNLAILLDAISMDSDIRLVIAGESGWGSSDLERRIADSPQIVNVGYVKDPELRVLYEGAGVLAMPSLYEGFGLPALEAMSLGVPVACSNIPILAEVTGEAAVRFDPTDADECLAALRRCLNEGDALRTAGYARAKEFDWTVTAETAARLFARLVATGGAM